MDNLMDDIFSIDNFDGRKFEKLKIKECVNKQTTNEWMNEWMEKTKKLKNLKDRLKE